MKCLVYSSIGKVDHELLYDSWSRLKLFASHTRLYSLGLFIALADALNLSGRPLEMYFPFRGFVTGNI